MATFSVSPRLRKWLEKDGFHGHISGGMVTVDDNAFHHMFERAKHHHPEYTFEETKDWAIFSVLTHPNCHRQIPVAKKKTVWDHPLVRIAIIAALVALFILIALHVKAEPIPHNAVDLRQNLDALILRPPIFAQGAGGFVTATSHTMFFNGTAWVAVTSGAPFPITCISGCISGGGSGTSSSFGAAFPVTGTAIGVKNGSNMVNLTADGSGNLNVNLNANSFGNIGVTQQTSPWVVSANGGTFAVTQSGSWNVGQSGTWTVQQGGAPWSVSASGNFGVTQQTSPWVVSCTSGSNCPVNATLQAGSTTAVTQTTSPWVSSLVSPSGLATGIGSSPLAVSDSPFPTWGANSPGASAVRSELTACQFNAPLTKLTVGQSLPVQCDPYGNVKVTVVSQPAPLPTVTTPVVVGTLTDRSGTVITGGTSQVLAPANPGRKYLVVENPTTATEALYVNFTSAASTAGSSSISLSPGGSLTMTAATYVSQEVVTVTAATTAHAFTAKEQ